MFTPNQLILGKYRIERELGRGAFGVVYLARHKDLETLVAIKTLHKDAPYVGSTEYSNDRAQFSLEAQISAKIKHPNVLRVLDFAEQDGSLILVMDYAAGGSLAERLQQGGPLPIAQVCQILREAAAGLNALHEADLVHRDVKPSNMLLDGNGRVLIADMGLAQVGNTSRDSRDASFALPHPGTPKYMSPEHSNGNEPLSPSADVYSLGCVAFEMLTGKLWKTECDRVREVRDLRPDTPDWLNSLVTRMLKQAPAIEYDDASDVNKRYIDCQAVLVAIQQVEAKAEAEAKRKAEEAIKQQAEVEAKRKAKAAEAKRQTEVEAKAWCERGKSNWWNKDYDRAIANYNKAIELNPNNPDYWWNRGLSYHNKGDYDRAIADHSKAIELDPNDPVYWYFRGVSCHGKKDYELAITNYNKAIELNPNKPTYWWERGLSYDWKKDYDSAIADYNKAIELNPNDPVYWYFRGVSYDWKKDYNRAIADHNKAIELDPNNLNYWYFRNLTYRAKGDITRADADLAKAKELGWK